jgi:putative mycofactocin binding protein MftB
MNKRYTLAKGTQVREEDFGLLFYQKNGPRLHFVASGSLLSEDFFIGKMTLEEWMGASDGLPDNRVQAAEAVGRALEQLTHKGVIVEC